MCVMMGHCGDGTESDKNTSFSRCCLILLVQKKPIFLLAIFLGTRDTRSCPVVKLKQRCIS